jgi:hypothetical protein
MQLTSFKESITYSGNPRAIRNGMSNTTLEQEFTHLSTDDLMKAYAGAIEASTLATQEMMQKAETAGFRAARVRLDYCRQTCDDLREALFLRFVERDRINP